MSDDLDFDMEVVEEDELDELGADGADSGELSRSVREEDGEFVESNVDGIYRTEPEDKSENRKSNSERWSALGTPPEDWETRKVGSLTEMRNGEATDHTDEGEVEYTVYGSNGPIGSYREPNFDGGLVVGRVGAVGEVEWVPEAAWVSDNAIQLSVKEAVNDLYLYYALDDYEMAALATTTAQPLLNQSTVSRVSIPTPSLPEQRKIASVLCAVDQAIQKTEAIIARTQNVLRGLTDKLLVEGIETERTHHRRIYSFEFEMPTDWRIVELEELNRDSKPICYGIVQPGEHYAEGIPLLNIENAKRRDGVDVSKLHRVHPDLHEKYSRSKLEGGEIVISVKGSTGDVGVVPSNIGEWNISRDLARISPKSNIERDWLRLYLSSRLAQKFIHVNSPGSTRDSLNIGDLKQIPILLPPAETQSRISSVITRVEKKESVELELRSRLSRLRKGLMQDLLTGEVRTTDKAIDVLDEVKAHG